MKKSKINLKNAAMFIACFIIGISIFFGCNKEKSLSDKKQIIAFTFEEPVAVGSIDQNTKTVSVKVPEGSDVKALIPTIMVSEKATVSPASRVAQDFTNPVVYTVTAEDGSFVKYTVTVEINKSNNKQITSFKITVPPREGVINEAAKTISINNIPMGTVITALVPNITMSEKATVSPASGVAQDFTNPVIYTVTAEDGTTATYTVTVAILDERDEWVGEYITTYHYTIGGEDKSDTYILKIRKISNTPNGVFLDGFLKNCEDLALTEELSVYAEIKGNEMTIDSLNLYQGIKFSGSGNRDKRVVTIHNTATLQGGVTISFTQIAKKD